MKQESSIEIEKIEFNKEVENLIKDYKSSSRKLKVASIVILTFGILFLIFNNTSLQKEVYETKKQIVIQKSEIDSLSRIDSRKENIKENIFNYFEKEKNISDTGAISFFTNKVERYYLKTNLSIAEVKEEMEQHLNRYPESSVIFDSKNVTVEILPDSNSHVFLKAIYLKNKESQKVEILYEIKLNPQNKIFYIRNLVPNKELASIFTF